MANSSSAKKRIRTIEKRTIRNKASRSQIRTYLTKAKKSLETGDVAVAEVAVKQAICTLDKYSHRNIIHPNAAARQKSKLTKKLTAIRAASAD